MINILFSINILFFYLENTTVRSNHITNEDEEMGEDDIRAVEDEEMGKDDIEVEDEEMEEDEIEAAEDDIELESEYERIMTEFNESDEDKDDGEETNEDNDSIEEVIIDQPLNIDQMPRSFGEFAPYFKNITESLFFCWMQKHRICKLDSPKTL